MEFCLNLWKLFIRLALLSFMVLVGWYMYHSIFFATVSGTLVCQNTPLMNAFIEQCPTLASRTTTMVPIYNPHLQTMVYTVVSSLGSVRFALSERLTLADGGYVCIEWLNRPDPKVHNRKSGPEMD